MNTDLLVSIGLWIRSKYRLRVKEIDALREPDDESGHYIVAKQLRKQGIPLEVARLILF